MPVTPTRSLLRESVSWGRSRLPSSFVAGAVRYVHRRRGVDIVERVEDLDRHFARAHEAFAVSDAAGREVLRSFELSPRIVPPDDPFSWQYREAQLDLYRTIAGRDDYEVANETSDFDLVRALERPFPYSTGSPTVVGDQLVAAGFLVKTLDLPEGSTVVEFGPGWGTTTEIFLALGYEVTVVEIEPKFCELIEERCRPYRHRLHVANTDMLTFESRTSYDAAAFFESFHHCDDHLRMLTRLRDHVGTGGRVAFAAEPIADFPMPWGVRLDGESLWSMRVHGWLELGFDHRYFDRALARTGWRGARYASSAISHYSDVIIATPEAGA